MISTDKVLIRGFNGTTKEPLNCIVWSSFYLSWEKNSTREIQATLFNDGSLAYDLVDIEASIYFEGQEFLVKQSEPDFSQGTETVQIVAIHVSNDVSRIYQHNVRTGELTYSPKDVLAFYFDGNSQGFSYEVIGTFENQQITDLGNSSGSDCLSKIVDTWPLAVIYADNRHIKVYSSEAFKQDLGNRIDYIHNTSEIQISYDSTGMTNQVKAYGKELETDSDTDDDTTHYYFEPFIVSDDSSIKKWGVHPTDDISDERFTDANSMKNYVLSQFISEPSLSIDVTLNSNEKPTAGEVRRLEIRTKGFVTSVEVMEFQWYPFDASQPTTMTLNNTAKTILDYQSNNKNQIQEVIKNTQNIINKYGNVNINNGSTETIKNWTSEEVDEFGSNIASH